RGPSTFQPSPTEGMDRKMVARACLGLALLALPATANADASWSFSARSGAVAVSAPAVGGTPCPRASADAGSVGGLTANGQVTVDGGSDDQTTHTRTPLASVGLRALTIY